MVLQALFYDWNRSSLAVGGPVGNLLAGRVGREWPGKSDQTDGRLTVLTKHHFVKYCRVSSAYSEAFSIFQHPFHQPEPVSNRLAGRPTCYFD